MSAEVTPGSKGRIPRPQLKGRHIAHVWKIVGYSLGGSFLGAAIFAYYGIYRHHNNYRTWFQNFDQEARRDRIKVGVYL